MKKFFILSLVTSLILFAYLYQKAKILILSYQISQHKSQLKELSEEAFEISYYLYSKIDLDTLNKKIVEEGLTLSYPQKYVRIEVKPASQRVKSPGLLARILGISKKVEAKP